LIARFIGCVSQSCHSTKSVQPEQMRRYLPLCNKARRISILTP
jgi:hypothetical protein